ncbi:MAG: SDR family oxidoreductase [Alphaproteobacteria bacterium]
MTPPRTVLVTGGGRRIGRAIATALAADGWAVALHCNHSMADAAAAVAAIRTAGGRAAVLPADLTDEGAVADLLPRAAAALGPVACLVNNASVFERDDAASATKASWDLHMAVNLRAPFVLIQAMAAALPPDMEGTVVNILDQRVWNLSPDFLSYTLSKAGLWTLTQTLAVALAPRIRVNAIGPGPTLPSPRQTAEQFARQAARVPLGRPTDTADIVAALRLILSARSMTGQMIALDGGQHLGWATPSPDDRIDE